ncbi:aspartyl-tRNA synthetase [Nematocida sp. AWRm77]|nr:aspartyl-tRNA synthetase [Nematocida sp. AWRm77]
MTEETHSRTKEETKQDSALERSLAALSVGPKKRHVSEMEKTAEGEKVSLYGHLLAIRPVGKNKAFLVLRQGMHTIQGVFSKGPGDTEEVLGRIRGLPVESYIKIEGTAVRTKTPVTSCTVSKTEVKVEGVEEISRAEALPFHLKDVQWTAQERKENPELPSVKYASRLNHRYVDLRSVETRSIFRVYSAVTNLFREYLLQKEYLEVRSPKLLSGSSEGGADVFEVSYFGGKATLAQSPQLYKQMAIIGGMEKVFEIGACYRAENSNTGRHLTEFTGVDLECELQDGTYVDLIKEIYGMLRHVITTVQETHCMELSAISSITGVSVATVVPECPTILTFKECADILREIGREGSYHADMGTEDERELGAEVRRRYGTDLFVVTEYPESARPFYTSLCPDVQYTQSFDFILKGEEISSGAERIHQKDVLIQRVKEKGLSLGGLQSYIDAFSFGTPRHGGCGIGLERVIKLITGVGDIHKCSMFPRDPTRLTP